MWQAIGYGKQREISGSHLNTRAQARASYRILEAEVCATVRAEIFCVREMSLCRDNRWGNCQYRIPRSK